MTILYNHKRTRAIRRNLRRQNPPPELLLWQKLRHRQLLGYKFRRQYGIGDYIVDFYCSQSKLIIEIDGESHFTDYTAKQQDQTRQHYLESLGHRVVRYLNTDIYQNLNSVLEDISSHLTHSPHPIPLLGKERGPQPSRHTSKLRPTTPHTTFTISSHQSRTIRLSRSGHYIVKLIGEGAGVTITSAFWLTGHDLLHLDLTVIHSAPHTTADIHLKAIAIGHAQAFLTGTIIVQPAAHHTQSFLSQKVLLLSRRAQAQSIPNLEIMNHDVKCSHAATVSSLDPHQLFYLTSRGLSPTQAKRLLARGFLNSQ